MSFQGFSPEAVDFLWQIRLNNEREWFLSHKQQYEQLIRQPLGQLAEEVRRRVTERWPKLPLDLHVSRIYRDARRLHGRGPYKDHMWIVLHLPRGDHGTSPAFYFEIAPEYYSIGMGYYSATPMTMAKLRARIDCDPVPAEKLARRLKRQSNFVLEGELYRRPKADKGPLLNDWYNRKSIAIAWDRNCEGSLYTPHLADEIVDSIAFLMPYFEYLATLDSEPEPSAK